jgi:hypothetical protein
MNGHSWVSHAAIHNCWWRRSQETLRLATSDVARGMGYSMKIRIDDQSGNTRGWLISVLTDIHFWVPVVVLIGGLLLLRWIH